MARITSVGIVGYGAFARLLHHLLTRFVPNVNVRVYARKKNPDGETFFSLEEVCKADAVILAVPIREIESVLKTILPLLRAETIIVDVATVKVHTAKLLKKYAKNRRYIASHPMFGPESYEKSSRSIKGFRVVITENTLPVREYAELIAFLRQSGLIVVEMSAKEHDQHLANTLFLTHFIGQTVSRAGFTHTDIDTVSFRFLMDAVESVRNDTALFQDVFRFNPYCKETLRKLKLAESKTYSLLRKSARN